LVTYVHLEALENRLTDLLEITTGLIGKSVFLEVKFETEAAVFIAEWFGEGNNDVDIQAFVHLEGENRATVNTTKFVKIPNGAEKLLHVDIKILRGATQHF
jgi:hypothetical protein